MKIIKLSFFISLLSSSYCCWAMDPPTDPEFQPLHSSKSTPSPENIDNALSEVINENFVWNPDIRAPQCITKPEELSNVRKVFGDLTVHSPAHKQLNLYLARFLLYKKEYREGLQRFSWVILNQETTHDEITEYMNAFKLIAIEKKDLTPYINSLNSAFNNPNEFRQHNNSLSNIKNPRTKQGIKKLNQNVTELVIEQAISLLNLLKKVQMKYCYDAVLQTILTTMRTHGYIDAVSKLVRRLYEQEGVQASSLLRQDYVLHCLVKEKKYEQAIPMFESILFGTAPEDNYLKTPMNYNKLGMLRLATTRPVKEKTLNGFKEFEYSPEDTNKLTTALELMKLATQLDGTHYPPLLKNLAALHLFLKQYKEALEIYRPLMKLSDDKLKEYGCSPKAFKRDYLVILHAAEATEELDQIYREKIEEHFTKNKKIAGLIKAAQAQTEEEKRQRKLEAQQQAEKLALARQAELAKKESQIIPEQILPEKEIPQIPLEEKEPIIIKQPKKKTKGVPTKQVSNVPPAEPLKKQAVIYIHQLGLNKTSQKTFKEFFAKYTEDREPRVSLRAFNSFCENLDDLRKASAGNKQPLKKSLNTHGGSSHQKFTFSPKDFEIDGEEQMTIVTSLIEEKPYQVQHLLNIFLNARIVPDDPALINKLEDLGLL